MEGLNLPIGSVQEQFAIRAFKDRQEITYIKSLLMVQSVMAAADRIAAAVTGESSSSADKLSDLLRTFKELLIPECIEERDEKAKKVKKLMEEEAKIGSFQVEPMVYGQRKKKGLN